MDPKIAKRIGQLHSSLEKCGEDEAASLVKEAFFNKIKNWLTGEDPLDEIRSGSMTVGRGDSDSRGKPVSAIQQLLVDKGYSLPKYGVDGKFGPETDAAVRSFQEDSGLLVDGIIGANTMNKLSPTTPSFLKDLWNRLPFFGQQEQVQNMIYNGKDLGPLAASIGISPVFLKAVLNIESAGRSDAIRFEPHIFNRKMEEQGRAERVPFTKGSTVFSQVPEETNKDAFWRAYHIDKIAAIISTSWGTGQVMGKHLLRFYNTPDEAVNAFFEKPDDMSANLLVSWFKDNPGAIKAANNLNFQEFARIYNGPLYYQNQYDKHLANSYQKVSAQHPEMLA